MPEPPEPQERATAEVRPPQAPPVVTPIRVVIGLCLFVPFVAMLWVATYARTGPALFGMPFFYWYQMAWVLISAVLTSVAYQLVKRDEAARRAARGEDGTQ
jgi:hypothetical protein